MQRKKMLIAGLAIALMVGLVSASVITYFGQVKMTATVTPAVLLDGESYPTVIEETADVAGGESLCRLHWLESKTSVPVELQFVTTFSPALWADEITVAYYRVLGYRFVYESDSTDVTVEDLGCKVRWTMTVDWNHDDYKNGQAAWSVSIGVGDTILYQVHNNDGTDPKYPWGTYLYSEYVEGWHTATTNTPVTEIDGITGTGERYKTGNPDGVYTIEIDKTLLDCEEFKWVVWINYKNTSTTGTFSWSDTSTTNFHTAKVGTEIIDSFVLQPKETLNFLICYSFDVLIAPGDYTIYSTVKPA